MKWLRSLDSAASGTLVYGELGADHETQLVCGHFAFNDLASHPIIEALPSHIHIPNFGHGSHDWLDSTLRFIGAEAGVHGLGGDLISLKLSEIIFAQAVRIYLNNEGKELPVLAGLGDPKITLALGAMHKDPAHPWVLDELSAIANLSRTAFAQRFSKTMAMTPIHYLTFWRMQKARQLLSEQHLPIIEVALQSGYNSEAAFSRVFKKYFAVPPASYRRSFEM